MNLTAVLLLSAGSMLLGVVGSAPIVAWYVRRSVEHEWADDVVETRRILDGWVEEVREPIALPAAPAPDPALDPARPSLTDTVAAVWRDAEPGETPGQRGPQLPDQPVVDPDADGPFWYRGRRRRTLGRRVRTAVAGWWSATRPADVHAPVRAGLAPRNAGWSGPGDSPALRRIAAEWAGINLVPVAAALMGQPGRDDLVGAAT